MTGKIPPLSPRLSLAASFVREGAVLADIGTDHGFLPISLLLSGKIARAVLSDVNEGPLACARGNVLAAGVSDRAAFCLSDGADGLSDPGITDYAVCGMGGELIAAIVSRSEAMKGDGVSLVLQPMTRAAHLRRALLKGGFAILREAFVFDAGKYYVCMLSRYTGTPRIPSDFLAEFGAFAPEAAKSDPAARGYLSSRVRALRRAAEGKRKGGLDPSYEEDLLSELRKQGVLL